MARLSATGSRHNFSTWWPINNTCDRTLHLKRAVATMPTLKAVRFEEYGDVEVLPVPSVPRPSSKAGEVLLRVKAAGISLGETVVCRGDYPSR